MKGKARGIPSLYWKAHELLKKCELDDESLIAKDLAHKFRINKWEAKKIRKELEYWFGEKPNGGEKRDDSKTKKSGKA